VRDILAMTGYGDEVVDVGTPDVADRTLTVRATHRPTTGPCTVRIALHDLRVTVTLDNGTVVHDAFANKTQGIPVRRDICSVHKDVQPDLQWSVTRPSVSKAVFRAVDGSSTTEVGFHNMDRLGHETARVSLPNARPLQVSARRQVVLVREAYDDAIHQAVVNRFNLGWAIIGNNNTNNIVVNIYSNIGVPADTRSFVKLRDVALGTAERAKLRKLGGHVWRPVPGCPRAYSMAETYREFLNATLDDQPVYYEHPALQNELINLLTNYNPPQMHDVEFDRGLLSFQNGIVITSLHDKAWEFVPTEDVADRVADGAVARHHFDVPFVHGCPTPLIDDVLALQFSPEVVHTMYVMLGRLLYPLGTHDNWQVLPWMVGTAGTGKSLVQDVVAALFDPTATAALTGNQEQTFGLDGKYSSHVLLGRDLPRMMSSVLSQELLQCMISAEPVCVPRKGLMALNVKWQVPMLFASNQLPDYADANGQIVRRLVPFIFERGVVRPDMTLCARIVDTELPGVLRKALDTYLDAVKFHGPSGFCEWCPGELKAAQKEVGVATSYVRRFLALGPDDGCTLSATRKSGPRSRLSRPPTPSTCACITKASTCPRPSTRPL
jgi:hypothetical protein